MPYETVRQPKFCPEEWIDKDRIHHCGAVIKMHPFVNHPAFCFKHTDNNEETCSHHRDNKSLEMTRLHRHHVRAQFSMLSRLMNSPELRTENDSTSPILLKEFLTLVAENLWCFRLDRDEQTKNLLLQKSTCKTLVYFCFKYPSLRHHFLQLYPMAPSLEVFRPWYQSLQKQHRMNQKWYRRMYGWIRKKMN